MVKDASIISEEGRESRIDVYTRKVRITHISCQWNESVILNVFRGLLDGIDGDLLRKRYLIMDRDPLFTKALAAA